MKGDSWVILNSFFLSSTPRGIFEWQAKEAGERFRAMYSPLWGCAGDRDEMVVKVLRGAVFGHDVENASKQPTVHFEWNHLHPVLCAASKWRITVYYYHLVFITSRTSTDDHLFATATTITKMVIVERSNCII